VIFIPTDNPTNELIKLLVKLTKKYNFENSKIVVINDYSKNPKSKQIYNIIQKYGCTIIDNKNKKGKGAAIKYGIEYSISKKLPFALFTDGDGQHSADDISKMYSLAHSNNKCIIGVRDFTNSPFLNKVANKFSNFVFNLVTKINLKDTQCGLRLIPSNLYNILLDIKQNKFDFELISLFEILSNNSHIKELPIKTIYFEKKRITSFNKIVDTILIIKIFLIYFFSKKYFTKI
tara:strand:- start:23732 stop:24430 length:699 start_codon:yes stop_codon:yes gene_type:complete